MADHGQPIMRALELGAGEGWADREAVSLEATRNRRAHVAQVGIMAQDDCTRRGIGGRPMSVMLDTAATG